MLYSRKSCMVEHGVLLAASLPMSDFEDALQCAAAMAADAAVIVTRNLTDYRNSPVAAMTPEQILDELDIRDVWHVQGGITETNAYL